MALRRAALLTSVLTIVACGETEWPRELPQRGDDGDRMRDADGESDGGGESEGEGESDGEGEDEPSVDPPTLTEQELFDDFVAYTEDLMAAYEIPGATVAVATGGAVRFAAGIGRKNDVGDDVTVDTLFRPGSIGKMMTAAALLTLVEEDALDLDAPVPSLVPAFHTDGGDASAVTVHALLTHTSGLYDGGEFLCATDDASAQRWFTNNAQPLWSPPGRLFNYSNPGYALAGHVLETIAGEPFTDAINHRVFAPAGMTSVRYGPEAVSAHGDYAIGYELWDGTQWSVAPADVECGWMRPAGLWWATASDLARFGALLAADGGDLLTADSVARMSTGLVQTGAHEAYGYGLSVWPDYHGRRLLLHSGNITGFSSILVVAPDDDVAVAVMWSRSDLDPTYTGLTAMNMFLGLPLDASTPYEEPGPPPSTYARYAGTFSDPYLLGDIVVTLEDGQLWADFGSFGEKLLLSDPLEDTFVVNLAAASDPSLPWAATFFFDDDGNVEYFASRWGVGVAVE